MFLIPKPGVKVRDPQTRLHLPPDGAEKSESSYWLRRLRDGDVTVDEPQAVAADAAGHE
jgi:hypothetical protein